MKFFYFISFLFFVCYAEFLETDSIQGNDGKIRMKDTLEIITAPVDNLDSLFGFTAGSRKMKCGKFPDTVTYSDTATISRHLIHEVDTPYVPRASSDTTFTKSTIHMNGDTVMIDSVPEPNTADTLLWFESGKVCKLSKCDATFPAQFHYHTTSSFVGFIDSLDNIRDQLSDTADVLRSERTAEISDTADAIRGQISDTADILRTERTAEISDTADALRGQMSDTADVLRGEISDSIQHGVTVDYYPKSAGGADWADGNTYESGGYVVFGIPSQTLIAGADPTHSFILSGAASYTMGIDDSNNDYFCIRPGTSVGNAGLLMNADGDVGVGPYTPISPGAFSVYKSTTNVQNYGLYGLPISNSSANGNHSVVGFYGYARARPDAGVTNSGVCQGVNGAALLDDLGTVSEGAAVVSYIGDLNKAGTWSEAVGLKVIHYRQAATEDWYADIKLEDICTGGSVTEDWCIYSEHDAPSRLINDLQLDADDVYLQLGAAQDFEVSYDGTDGILNPRAIGSGNLKINGNVYPNTDDTYYVGKNDDDSPFAYKGIILKDQTDGKYYRIELNNGSVDVVDLTD